MTDVEYWDLPNALAYVTVIVGDRGWATEQLLARLRNGDLNTTAARMYVTSESDGTAKTTNVPIPADFWEWAKVAWLDPESYAHRAPWFRLGYTPSPSDLDPLLSYQVFGVQFLSSEVKQCWPQQVRAPTGCEALAASKTSRQSVAAIVGKKGGRPASMHRDDVADFIRQRIDRDGYPDSENVLGWRTQADVGKWLRDKHAKFVGEISDSQLRAWIRTTLKQLDLSMSESRK